VSPDCRANYLASPPLVVAYALKGTVRSDMVNDPIGTASNGEPVYLKDIWPTNEEIRELIDAHVHSAMFRRRYADVYHGDERWRAIEVTGSDTYNWPALSTYIQNPPYFTGMTMDASPPSDIEGARPLAIFGDSITTDHISPAGAIKPDSPAGRYLLEHGVSRGEFNSYGSRRGNHEVMMRGTFANIRIRNRMLDNVEGGFTRYAPTGEVMPIYDAAMLYKHDGRPLVVIAGKEYGTGSSRDWAAKGTVLLGVGAVIAQSFERIHRSNLLGMGVLPLQFHEGENAETLGLTGAEKYTIRGIADVQPRQDLDVQVERDNGEAFSFTARCRIDTFNELEYFKAGGILQYVLRRLAAA
jgi:aconitate hydratase